MMLLYLFAALAAVFATALLVLPTVRVVQGRLRPTSAMGLWISGAGFALLALAAFALQGEEARSAVLVGVTATVVGWMIQRSAMRAAEAERSSSDSAGSARP